MPAILILTLNWVLADPMLSVIIALLIVYNTRGLMVRVANVLLEGAPEHIDVYRLCSELEEMEASHCSTTFTSGRLPPATRRITAHILLDPSYGGDVSRLLPQMREKARREFGIGHITLQLERTASDCTAEEH